MKKGRSASTNWTMASSVGVTTKQHKNKRPLFGAVFCTAIMNNTRNCAVSRVELSDYQPRILHSSLLEQAAIPSVTSDSKRAASSFRCKFIDFVPSFLWVLQICAAAVRIINCVRATGAVVFFFAARTARQSGTSQEGQKQRHQGRVAKRFSYCDHVQSS